MRRLYSKLKAFLLASALVVTFSFMLILVKQYEETLEWQHGNLDKNKVYFIFGNKSSTSRNLGYERNVISRVSTMKHISGTNNSDFGRVIASKGDSLFEEISLPKWNMRSMLERTRNKKYKSFKPVITETEHTDMLELLRTFKTVCDLNNLTFMLYGGSMLGAYRHFGLIPWDDDMDVMMNVSDANRIKLAFERVPGYTLVHKPDRQWKFYRSDTTANKSCCTNIDTRFDQPSCQCNSWPYIDIFFFKENNTHIWDSNEMYSGVYCYKKSDVFPLIGFPFEKFIMPVPRNIRNVLDKSYNVDLCVTLHFSHRREQLSGRVNTMPCRRLFPFFTFVFENYYGNVVKRSLMLGDALVYYTFSYK